VGITISLQMTQNNVGALVVVKPGEQTSIAGIITERGMPQFSFWVNTKLIWVLA